jgi:DNA-binding transcriptional MerR regulator
MPDSVQVEIPNRALFKAVEVCDLVKVQPYVLRSWEAEFPALGIAKTAGGVRLYRREDVEQVVRIKHLLLVEGLTLAGARRKLADEAAPLASSEAVVDDLIGQNVRERLTEIKRGLRSILELLARDGADTFQLQPTKPALRVWPTPLAGPETPARGSAAAAHAGTKATSSSRRKHSA